MRLITLILSLLPLFAFAQTPINPVVRFQVQSSTGSTPNFTVDGVVYDDTGNFDATSIVEGDSLYVIDGPSLVIFTIDTIYEAIGPLLSVGVFNADAGYVPIEEAAIIHPTGEYYFPTFVSSLRNDLMALIMNRFSISVDAAIKEAEEITDFIGGTAAVPYVGPSPPGTVIGETWRNSVGVLYRWDGFNWWRDGGTQFDTLFVDDPGTGLGNLILQGPFDTLSVSVLDIAPLQSLFSSNGELTFTPGLGGSLDVKIAQQGATSGQALLWNGTFWQPGTISSENTQALQGLTESGDTLYLGDYYNYGYPVAPNMTNSRAIIAEGEDPGQPWTFLGFNDVSNYLGYRFVVAEDSIKLQNAVNNGYSATTSAATFVEAADNFLTIAATNGSGRYGAFEVGGTFNRLRHTLSSNTYSELTALDTTATMFARNTVTTNQFRIRPYGGYSIKIIDYSGDLSASYNANTLVQKSYVDGLIAAIPSYYSTYRDNGGDETQRNNANFVSTSDIVFGLIDDGANDETEIRAEIPDGAVDLAEIQDISTNTLIGRYDAGTGVPQLLTIGSGFSTAGGTLDALDDDPTNEYNLTFEVGGGELTITDGGGSLGVLLTDIAPDQSITNEIQRLDTFEIVSNILRASLLNDAVPFSSVDLSPYLDNTDAQTLSWNVSTGEITISGGNTVDIDGRYLEAEVDGVIGNEYNTNFLVSGSNLRITDGGGNLDVPLTSISPFQTAANGLTSSGSEIRQGGTFTLATTNLDAGTNRVVYTSARTSGSVDAAYVFSNSATTGTAATALQATVVNNNTNSSALNAAATGLAYGVVGSSTTGGGVRGVSTSGTGMQAVSTSGTALSMQSTTGAAFSGNITPASTNTYASSGQFNRNSSGTAANGIGNYIGFANETSDNNAYLTGWLGFGWTDVTTATRTGDFQLHIVNNTSTVERLKILGSTGATTLSGYGAGSITGTATYGAYFDATGKIVEGPAYSAGTGTYYQTFRDNGSGVTQRPVANFVSTSDIVATLTDDAGNTETEVALTIATNGVDYSQFQQLPANTFFGNPTGSTANGTAITLGAGLSFSGGDLVATDPSITNEAWTIDADDADTEVISNQTVKFEGAGGVTTDYDPTTNTLLITGGGGSSYYQTIEDEGTPLTQRSTLDVIGSGIGAFDSGGETKLTLDDILNELVTDLGGSSAYAVKIDATNWVVRTFQEGHGLDVTNGSGVAGNTTYAVDETELTASLIPIVDAGGYFTTDNIEAALQQLGASGGSSFYQTVRENNVGQTQQPNLNFVDSGFISFFASNDAGNSETELTASINNASITSTQLADNSVGTSELINANVTLAKLQNFSQGTFPARYSASSGSLEVATISTGLDLDSGTGNLVVDETELTTSLLPLVDAGTYFTTDNPEAALQQIGSALTVPVGRVTFGAVSGFITSDAGMTYDATNNDLSVAGHVLAGDGTSTNPGLSFISDDGSGIFKNGTIMDIIATSAPSPVRIDIHAGSSTDNSDFGGNISIAAGNGFGGGTVFFTAGDGVSTNGGNVEFYAGNSSTLGGGDMFFYPGSGATGASDGRVLFAGNGMVWPIKTTTERNNFGLAINGTTIYNSTTGTFQGRAGGTWVDFATGGITSLGGLTASTQTFATGTSGTDFNISSVTSTHTFNLPVASGSNTGKLSSSDWTTFNAKIGGSGTTNFIPKFTGSSTIGNSIIVDDGTDLSFNNTTGNVVFEWSNTNGYGSFLGEFQELRIDNTGTNGATFIDNAATPLGIKYDVDYSATFVNRSLIDKEYADEHLGTRPLSTAAPSTNDVIAWNGSAWAPTAPGAGSGITTLNTLTASTQTFAIGTSGLSPAFSSATSTHTLNIPNASTSSVTAGLISNADYVGFAGKAPGDASYLALGTSSGLSAERVFTAGNNIEVTDAGAGSTYTVASGTGAIAYTGIISPAQLTSDQDDWNPTGLSTASTINIDGDSGIRLITGIQGGSSGRRLILNNVGSYTVMLVGKCGKSSAANRFGFNGVNYLEPGETIELTYNATTSLWYTNVVKNPEFRGRTLDLSVGSITAADWGNISLVAIGTGGVSTQSPTTGQQGNYTLATGTTTTGGYKVVLAKGGIAGAADLTSGECIAHIKTSSPLSDGTDTYTIFVGFDDITNSTVSANNTLGFRYSHGINSGKWQAYSKNNSGTETTIDSGVTVAILTEYTFRVILNKDNTSALFYINDTYVGEIATNLPINDSDLVSRVSITKSAGTTARQVRLIKLGYKSAY